MNLMELVCVLKGNCLVDFTELAEVVDTTFLLFRRESS